MTELKFEIPVNYSIEPAWKDKVDRWSQLDEVSYCFCEALHQANIAAKPDLILLAQADASNLADFDFVNTGAHSPAKFVFTLPNICAAVILQMLNFNGRVLCVNHGLKTLDFAKEEARIRHAKGEKVWVLSSSAALKEGRREVQILLT